MSSAFMLPGVVFLLLTILDAPFGFVSARSLLSALLTCCHLSGKQNLIVQLILCGFGEVLSGVCRTPLVPHFAPQRHTLPLLAALCCAG